MVEKYANPHNFEKLSILMPISFILSIIGFALGLYLGLWDSPPDYQQKETVRIMYIHVPAAWMSIGIFFGMGINSFFVIWRRHHLASLIARSLAPIGCVFALICLVTGSLWGRPTWGTYWIWDARLTSMLILFFLYIGYMMIYKMSDDLLKTTKIAAIFCMVGLIDLPIVKFSVEWWNTLHQGPSVIRAGGPSIHSSMLYPLMIMFFSYIFLTIGLCFLGVKTHLMKIKLHRFMRNLAQRGEKYA